MGEQDKDLRKPAITSTLLAVAVLLGLVLGPQLPFRSSRPTLPEHAIKSSPESARFPARLFEDPFTCILRAADSPRKGVAMQKFAEEIRERGDAVVLGVMVYGGPHFELIEKRKRYRYAVLAALNELGYVPDDPESLGCLSYEYDGERAEIPYEWLSLARADVDCEPSIKKNHVVVLWLKDQDFSKSPLCKLERVISQIMKNFRAVPRNYGSFEPAKPLKEPGIEFKILGPAGSTNLDFSPAGWVPVV